MRWRRATHTGRGTVKFWKADQGWGGIEGPDLLGDVWVHFAMIEGEGFRELHEGELVEVDYHRADQDSWRYVADSVRPFRTYPLSSNS